MSLCEIKSLRNSNKKIKIIIFNHTRFLRGKDSRPVEIGNKFEQCFREIFGDDHVNITHFKESEKEDGEHLRNGQPTFMEEGKRIYNKIKYFIYIHFFT